MVQIQIAFFLFLIGACFGSFAAATAWRIKHKRDIVKDRSECESCRHKLSALDLLPIVSWLTLKGRCRYCKAKISPLLPISELLLGLIFTISYLFWPYGFDVWQAIALFGLWLLYMVMLTILAIYDLHWMILPDKIVIPLICLSLFDAALRVSLLPDASIVTYVQYIVLGLLALPGIYGVLYLVSGGRWVGMGDIKLTVFMAIVLGWQGSLMVLFLGNILGLLLILPGLILGKLNIRSRIPFGPFLILGFVAAGLFGNSIINWYLSYLGL